MNQMFRARVRACLLGLLLLSSAPLAFAEYVSASQGYQVSVRVVPRIGGFLSNAYQEAWDSRCEPQRLERLIDWQAYEARLDASVAPLAYRLPYADEELNRDMGVPGWDILTTRSAEGRRDCGYLERRVLVSVKPSTGTGTLSCRFDFGKVPVRIVMAGPPEACARFVALRSNQEIKFKVDVTDSGSGATSRLSGSVPEDLLIVSMGDSYASGEGNPDVPGGSDARWMDARCHRSVYAGPIRAGVRILRQQGAIDNPRYQNALSAGALTVVSFACSGALLSSGLDGTYDGVSSFEEALASYPELRGVKPEPYLGVRPPIPSQLAQVKAFLENQGSEPKRRIDLMLLSAGGNDIQFGTLVTKMATKNISKGEMVDRLKSLQGHYTTFSERLAVLNAQYPAGQVILVKYPDPLYRNALENCTGKLDTSSGTFFDLVFGLAKAAGFMQLDEREVVDIRTKVLSPLNKLLDDQVKEHKRDWIVLDPTFTDTEDVREHGWCLGGATTAFESQGRWFRGVGDSRRFQGNMNGSFHPTFAFNEKIQGYLIAETFKANVNAEPNWEAVAVSPSKLLNGTLFVPPRPSFRYSGAARFLPTLSSIAVPGWNCRLDGGACTDGAGFTFGAHGNVLPIDGHALGSNPRRYEKKPVMTVRIDAQPPTISCRRPDAGAAAPCARKIGVRTGQLDLLVQDADAGVTFATVKGQGADGELFEIPFVRESDHVMSVPVKVDKDGSYKLSVCARDAVDNATGSAADCGVPFDLRVISTPLNLHSLHAYDIDWSDRGRIAHPGVPIFGDEPPYVKAGFSVAAEDVNCVPACQFRPAVPQALWERSPGQFIASDIAGNTTTVRYAAIRLPAYKTKNIVRTAGMWTSGGGIVSLPAALRAVFALQPGLPELVDTSKPGVPSALERLRNGQATVNEERAAAKRIIETMRDRALLVDWLNMVSGALLPTDDVPAERISKCIIEKGIRYPGFNQIQWLHYRTQCALSKDREDALAGR